MSVLSVIKIGHAVMILVSFGVTSVSHAHGGDYDSEYFAPNEQSTSYHNSHDEVQTFHYGSSYTGSSHYNSVHRSAIDCQTLRVCNSYDHCWLEKKCD